MPRLVLIRHAKAEQPQPGQADIDRHLAARGHADAAVARGHLASLSLPDPVVVLVSPAVRTQETYALVRDALPAHDHRDAAALYDAAVSTVVDLVDDAMGPGQDAGTVVVIGHNPTMRDAVGHLSGVPQQHLPTMAIAVLDGDAGAYGSGAWTLESVAVPRHDTGA